jgi:thioesterase domain-containing protein
VHAHSDDIDRHTLPPPERAPTEAAERPAASAPANAQELQLLLIWEEVLGQQGLSVQDNFFEVGGNSLLAAHLFALIEQRTGRKLPLATLFRAPTVARLAQVVWEQPDSQSAPVSWSSLVPIQPHGTRPPFFCVHAEGGNVVGYFEYVQGLHPEQPLYGLQARGLNGEEVGELSYENIAAAYLKEIRTVQPHGPYYLGGYCLGGDIAFEMAQQLKAQGEQTALVLMIENPRPHYRTNYRPGTTWLRRKFYQWEWRIDTSVNRLRLVNPAERLTFLRSLLTEEMVNLCVKVEARLHPLLARCGVKFRHSKAYMLANLIKNQNRAYADYHPRTYDGPVAIFRTRKQPPGIVIDPTIGWNSVLMGRVEFDEIAGPPIWDVRHVDEVATKIRVHLENAQRGSAATLAQRARAPAEDSSQYAAPKSASASA